jgi:hypothetical protein
MRPGCIGKAILAGVLAWPAMPAGCLAAVGASPRGAVASAPPAATEVWLVPGGTPGGAPGDRAAPRRDDAAVREARLLVAAAADELDALAAAARGEAPRGGPGRQPAFWSAAGALQRALADLDGALAVGDPACYSILGEAQRSLAAVEVAFRRAGTSREARRAAEAGAPSTAASDETARTARHMAALAAAIGRLGAYGREAVAAARRGGGLSAAQALQSQDMARAARSWRAALPALAAAARQRGDAALRGELAKLDALLQQVAAAQRLTLAAYLAAVSASNQALALWAANAAYLDPGEQQASQQADAAASDLTTAAETGFVFSADLSGGTAWTYAEGPPAGDPEAAAGDAGAAGGGGGSGPGEWVGEPGDGAGAADDAGGRAGEMSGGSGDAGGGSGGAGGSGGDASGGSGDAGGEWTGLPGESSAGVAGAAAAAAAASRWLVVHGGPDASWQPEASSAAAAEGFPRVAMQLGNAEEAEDEALSAGEWAAGAGDDTESDASSPLDWEELCRPWRPDAGSRGVCPLPPLAPSPPLPSVPAPPALQR